MPYLNITEVESGLSGLANAYPQLTELITLPNITHEGRTCHALWIGIHSHSTSTKDGVLFIGGVHAREWGSCEICINFAADLLEAYAEGKGLVYNPSMSDIYGTSFTSAQIKAIVENLHVFIFPLVNPDGRHYSQTVDSHSLWRKNRNPLPSSACEGVDINRNYDFIWDFPNLCSPPVPGSNNDVHDHTSTDPCHLTYHGTAPFSEPETQNVRWLLDIYPSIRWFVDIHSYSRLVLHAWGHDDNQSTDPAMNFMNPAYNEVRGVKGDTAYKEYIPADDLTSITGLAKCMHQAITWVRGETYKVMQSVDLYPTSGEGSDYVYSRHFVDPGKKKVHGFTLEWGTEFQPPWSEMENIILDITSGLIGFCVCCLNEMPEPLPNEMAEPPSKLKHWWKTFLLLIGGVDVDAGGVGITPGGKKVPIPPWDPMRYLGPAGRDALTSLAIAEMAGQLHDPALRDRIRREGLRAAQVAIQHLKELSPVSPTRRGA